MDNLDMEFIMTIVKLVMSGLAAFITTKVIPYVIANTSEKERDGAFYWINFGVRAAEQLEKDGKLSIPKKEFVMGFARKQIAKIGLDLTEEELSVLIEGFVNDLNLEQEEVRQEVIEVYPNQDQIEGKKQ